MSVGGQNVEVLLHKLRMYKLMIFSSDFSYGFQSFFELKFFTHFNF